ncbi:UNVERIFIED_CONTAM: hypothetical protein HDU68_002839, partial [Siphonaria sp. JEL0065]
WAKQKHHLRHGHLHMSIIDRVLHHHHHHHHTNNEDLTAIGDVVVDKPLVNVESTVATVESTQKNSDVDGVDNAEESLRDVTFLIEEPGVEYAQDEADAAEIVSDSDAVIAERINGRGMETWLMTRQ